MAVRLVVGLEAEGGDLFEPTWAPLFDLAELRLELVQLLPTVPARAEAEHRRLLLAGDRSDHLAVRSGEARVDFALGFGDLLRLSGSHSGGTDRGLGVVCGGCRCVRRLHEAFLSPSHCSSSSSGM